MGTRSQKQSPKQQPVTNVDTGNSLKLPDGLIGMRCTAQVRVEGKEVNCLLDTGSQVTTIPLSFYNSYLSHHPLQPLNRLLEVEGANGQAVPYLGYVELALKFPQEFLGAEAEIPKLALVVPDLTHVPQILIGTNTLDVLYADYLQETTHKAKSCYHGYRAVIRILEARRQQAGVSVLGQVKVKGEMPEVVAAESTVVLNGCVNIVGPVSETWVTVEPSASSSLPGGLLVASCLHSLPPKRNIQVPVVLKNETQVDLTIPPRAVLAEVHTVQSVIEGRNPVSSPVCKVVRPAQAKIVPDFGDSPLSSEWRERITDLVSSMSDVFALHDLDYGRTDKVKHHINLSDNTPFKQRSRPIHPQDVDAVRRHLKELLDAGVIRESESPFASPIVVVKKKNNDVRLCIDFRKLNSQTIKDAYALPNLEEAFSALTGSKWFSVLDLKSGFYQIEMEEADKHKTAFVCPLGFYEFNRMPQGVTNAPSSFQRLMERCMGDLNRREVLVFVDDLIESYRVASENASKVARRNKRRFDERVVASSLEIGDRVLVRNVKLRGKHKLADKWEKEVYIVIEKAVDLPVYTVQSEGKDGPLRTLHRDLLLPCGYLRENTPEEPVRPKIPRKPRTRANPGTEDPESVTEDSESENDCMDYYAPRHLQSVGNRILSNSRPQKQSIGGETAEASPEMRTVINTDPEQPTPVKLQVSLPNLPDAGEGIPLDEPEREDVRVMDPVTADMLSDLPVRDDPADMLSDLPVRDDPGLVEQRKESDESAPKISTEDNRTDVLPQDIVDDRANPQSDQAVVDQAGESILRRSQRLHEPPKRLQYPQLGNPLSLVMQSLLRGLSTAFTASLEESDCLWETPQGIKAGSPSAVIAQPGRCSGTCIS
ncbi:interleukin-1 receptor accessory protein-like 1-A [Pimephales promelas]|nr:interleukin-1 receptor accessory protein-like 1-A [Pimephales promelas]